MAQNLHFWSILARPCRLIQCPVGGSVNGCGARAVSRKTPIYFILSLWGVSTMHFSCPLRLCYIYHYPTSFDKAAVRLIWDCCSWIKWFLCVKFISEHTNSKVKRTQKGTKSWPSGCGEWIKHRKNCECCPGHSLTVNYLNRCLYSHCSHCSQCLLVSTIVY